ncbi:hypothetical protein YC2023_106770 [Brassica napus]
MRTGSRGVIRGGGRRLKAYRQPPEKNQRRTPKKMSSLSHTNKLENILSISYLSYVNIFQVSVVTKLCHEKKKKKQFNLKKMWIYMMELVLKERAARVISLHLSHHIKETKLVRSLPSRVEGVSSHCNAKLKLSLFFR